MRQSPPKPLRTDARDERHVQSFSRLRRHVSVDLHSWRERRFFAITSYETTPVGIFVPSSVGRVVLAAQMLPETIAALRKASHVLQHEGVL